MRVKAIQLVLASIIVLMFTKGNALGQVHIYPHEAKCGRIYADTANAMPPLSTSMPVNVLYGYMVLDSICKSVELNDINSRLNLMTTDSIRMAMKYYYDVYNYDPILFSEYAISSTLRQAYKTSIPDVIGAIFEKYALIASVTTKEWLIGWSPYIYHIRIESQSVSTDSTNRLRWKRFCATAQVLDKYKGMVLPDPSREADGTPEYVTLWWGRIESDQEGITVYDTAAYYAAREGFLAPGYEYIVFFTAEQILGNGSNRSYSLTNGEYSFELGTWALPVANGQVQDEKAYFSIGENITLSDFKAYIQSYRDSI